MEDFDIEKMAREYAEMLRAHDRVKTTPIEVPSEKRDLFFRLCSSAVRATEYLLSCVKIPWKKRVLLAICKQLRRIEPPEIRPRPHRYSSPESALTTLLYSALDMLDAADSFSPPSAHLDACSRLLPLISFLFI